MGEDGKQQVKNWNYGGGIGGSGRRTPQPINLADWPPLGQQH